MKYRMKPIDIELNTDYDVVVVGGGPAGCAAAVSAAREGAKTLLIESSGMLGGMATGGLVSSWAPYTDGERIIYGGISKKVFLETKAQMPHIPENRLDWVAIDSEALKYVYDKMLRGSGADVLFHTSLCAVEMADGRNVDKIIVANKAGLTAYKARVYVDCSGDADLYAYAGGEYIFGDGNGGVQPSSLCFMLTNVNEAAYAALKAAGELKPDVPGNIIDRIAADKECKIPDTHMVSCVVGAATVGFNAGHVWNIDGTDPSSVTEGIFSGRELAHRYLAALKKYAPDAFVGAYLVETAPTVGVRESRRIIGDYCFTLEDFLARRSFADEILRNNYFIDIHKSEEEQRTMPENAEKRYEHYKRGESHGLPYRCLCPRDFDNILVAGRTVSSDRITQGSLRVMPCCLCEGEAAGMAAAFAAESEDVNIHTVDVQRLRRRLIEEGAYLPKRETDTF